MTDDDAVTIDVRERCKLVVHGRNTFASLALGIIAEWGARFSSIID
jgi:hypothetical protein